MTVFLVRHGETPYHAENRYAGRSDIPLTDRGHAQALELAEWASEAGLTGIVASPLCRARMTAEPAARKTGLPLLLDERLVELDFGAAEGLTSQEMWERFPQARAAFEEDPYANPLPDGESPSAARDRGRAVIDELAQQRLASHQVGHRVLVVAHSTFLRIVMCDLLGVPLSRYRAVFPVIRNATGAVLRHRAGAWGLIAWNPPLSAGAHTW